MSDPSEPFHRRVLSGSDRGAVAVALRMLLGAAKPAYASLMRLRNFAFDHGVKKVHRLPRSVLAVGNLTTGGAGKTPMVRFLAEHFAARGLRPAILLRGYRSHPANGSDEARMLQHDLGDRAIVIANPDRAKGAAEAMNQTPPLDLFILDDAFQHRRIWRDFNLLLINATEPFGLGHVLPRGYLREPIAGIRRADAIVITRADQVSRDELAALDARIARLAHSIPVYHAVHAHTAVRCGDQVLGLEALERNFFAFSGIADPESFYHQLPPTKGFRSFADHHAYTPRDLDELRSSAIKAGAQILVTTEKDWIKLAGLPNLNDGLPVCRVQMQICFHADDHRRLMKQIERALAARPSAAAAAIPPG